MEKRGHVTCVERTSNHETKNDAGKEADTVGEEKEKEKKNRETQRTRNRTPGDSPSEDWSPGRANPTANTIRAKETKRAVEEPISSGELFFLTLQSDVQASTAQTSTDLILYTREGGDCLLPPLSHAYALHTRHSLLLVPPIIHHFPSGGMQRLYGNAT